MTRAAILLAAALAAPVAAHAAEDTDYPHRDWGQVATLDMTPADAAACIARGIARTYERVLTVPADGGTDIDAGPGGGLFGVAHDPWLRFKVRQAGDDVTLRVFYRRPVSRKQVGKLVDGLEKRCLKVKTVMPVNE